MDINKAFEVSSLTVYSFFTKGSIGYNIPQYQRPYSWGVENIDQLMDDICSGMFDVLKNNNEIHFMGTIITVVNDEFRRNINDSVKKAALPTQVENVIDGQQRLSTIALLGCCLYQEIKLIDKRLPDTEDYNNLKEATIKYLNELKTLFSYDLATRGTPKWKPIIIREREDEWTLDEKEENFYSSNVTSYIAKVIHAIDQSIDFPQPHDEKIIKNVNQIKQRLEDVKNVHEQNNQNRSGFPPAWEIIDKIEQKELWEYERTEIDNYINTFIQNKDNDVCSLIQLLGFSYYLLKCCCFTSIKPTSDIRAFDMFQSLNATGTPLTALETFKPLVINSIEEQSGQKFEGSNLEKDFKNVEKLFEKLESASSKNQRTNEYLTLYAQAYNGSKLSKQFSKQRSWLFNIYEKLNSLQEKESFIRQMGDVAYYCRQIYYTESANKIYNSVNNIVSERLKNSTDVKEAVVSILYLLDAKHKLSHTLLSRFFSMAIRSNDDEVKLDFLRSCKAIAAFFTLWRSALDKKYPDGEYKTLLKQADISWESNSTLTADILKNKLVEILINNQIYDKNIWLDKAVQNLRYKTSQAVCRFILFVTSEDIIIDQNEPGLMTIGRNGTTKRYLEPMQWISTNLETIEHVAPQNNSANQWDSHLYEDDSYDKIGNLTLLPGQVNTSASNKGWIEKYIYYSYLAERDPNQLEALKQIAINKGVNLNDSTIGLLEKSDYNDHILPLVQLGISREWNKDFVDRRTKRICDILWIRMNQWLS